MLTVTKPDRLARSTGELLSIEADLTKRGIGLVVLSMGGERLPSDGVPLASVLLLRGTLAVGPRASATAVIGFQLHHPLPIDGDAHAVATSLRPCRPRPPHGRRLEG